jgi:hypothetical protein
LHHVSEFYMGMSKKFFEYLSVSKGHLKASLGSAQNSTFVARVVWVTIPVLYAITHKIASNAQTAKI